MKTFMLMTVASFSIIACKGQKNTGNQELNRDLIPVVGAGDATSSEWGEVGFRPNGTLIEQLTIDLIRPEHRPGSTDSTLCYNVLDPEYILGSAACTKGGAQASVRAKHVTQTCTGSLTFKPVPVSEPLIMKSCASGTAKVIHFNYEPTVTFGVHPLGILEFQPPLGTKEAVLPQKAP